MSQRSLIVRLTPQKQKSRLDSNEELVLTTPENAKETVAQPAVSQRLVIHKEPTNVVRKRIIDIFLHNSKEVIARNKV